MENFKTAKLFDASGDTSQRWFLYYYFLSPDTGKYQRFRVWIPHRILTASGRRDKAHELSNQINKKLREGFNPFSHLEKRFTPIGLTMEFVLSIKENSCRKRTHHTYSSMVRVFRRWLEKKHLDKSPVDNFNYYQAQEFMDYTKSVLKNSNRTYNNRLTVMRTIFKILIRREWIMANPFEKIESLPREDPEITCFTIDELLLMQKHLPGWNYDLYVVACLIFYCFIRPQEIVRLRVSHFHLKTGTIILPGSVSKNKKHEVVQIPNALRGVLDKLDLDHPESWFVFAHKQHRGQKETAPTRIAEAWREFADHYGIEKNIYSLKHTGVGMALENGINIRDLQLQLRHSSLEMTQVYLDKFKRRPSEKLSANFPDLAQLTRNTGPVHLPLPAHIFNPGLS
jgi:integrase